MAEPNIEEVKTTRLIPPQPGTKLLYRRLMLILDREVGHGQEGSVWLASAVDQINTQRTYLCAVKFLSPKRAHDAAAKARFIRTFQVVRDRLSGESHICRLAALIEASDYGPWYFMEYLGHPGASGHQNLRDYLANQKDAGVLLTASHFCSLLHPVAMALDFAHSSGIIHSDVNPKNLIVYQKSQSEVHVKLIDFGEALILDDMEAYRQTGQWPSGGTPGYISPERRDGRPQSGQSDQYSLASIVHEMCLGQLPSADPETPAKPILIAPIAAEDEFREILKNGLHEDPAQRYFTCAAFISALLSVVQSDQPLSGRMLRGMIGLQRPKTLVSTGQIPFWAQSDFIPQRSRDPRRDQQVLQEKYGQLQQESEQLRGRLEKLQLEPVRVGIVGTRNAGKTSMFAVWSLFRNSLKDQVDLVITEETTSRYLRAITDELLAHGTTRPNAYVQPPQYLQMHVTVHNESWQLHTCDFSGEFLNFDANHDSPDATGTLEFLRQADMIIFLYDPKEQDFRIVDTIDRLFQTAPAELVLALTKIDQYWNFRKDPHVFPGIYRQLCRDFEALRQVDTKLSTSFARHGLKIIPISSFGKALDVKLPRDSVGPQLKATDLQPWQIFSPLAAAFQRRADDVRRLREQLNAVQTLAERLQKQLLFATEAARKRQVYLGSLQNDLTGIGKSIEEAEQRPGEPGLLESLRRDRKNLSKLQKTLYELRAEPEYQACIHLIRRLDLVEKDFQRNHRRYFIKNSLQSLREINLGSPWGFVLDWFRAGDMLSRLLSEIDDKGVADDLRNEFNEQQKLYRIRSLRIAATVIGAFVLLFLILLNL